MKKRSILPILFAVLALAGLELSHPLPAEAVNTLDNATSEIIQTKLLEPLQKKEANRSKFSRAALPPLTRRIRVLENTPLTDNQGRLFVPFAIDETRSSVVKDDEANWHNNAITGCVYLKTDEVMVKLGDVYYAASVLLGMKTAPAPAGVCRTK